MRGFWCGMRSMGGSNAIRDFIMYSFYWHSLVYFLSRLASRENAAKRLDIKAKTEICGIPEVEANSRKTNQNEREKENIVHDAWRLKLKAQQPQPCPRPPNPPLQSQYHYPSCRRQQKSWGQAMPVPGSELYPCPYSSHHLPFHLFRFPRRWWSAQDWRRRPRRHGGIDQPIRPS